jgi:hypothetical protein
MQAVSEIATKRSEINATGAQVAFVHMGTEEQAQRFFSRFGLDDVHRVSDRGRDLYRTFLLKRGTLRQLFGWKVWKRELRERVMLKNGIGKIIGDSFQLPGVFLIQHSEILKAFRHESVADKVDYVTLAK